MDLQPYDQKFQYHPFLFLAGTFSLTWFCAAVMATVPGDTALFVLLDFLESASPLLCALLLLRRHLTQRKFLRQFFLGKAAGFLPYGIVFGLFTAQFLNFYLFRIESSSLSLSAFAAVFLGQLLLGGGLEEGGWRGYLLPCFCRHCSPLLSSLAVSMIWVLWHLPYFFLPGGLQAGGSFLSYALIGAITGLILTAIYLLTKSVLLCTLFHSWQNAIVMTVPAGMAQTGFLLFFALLGAVSALLCLWVQKREHPKADS